jgi:ABC-type glycerol-3-phosphate transport system substrate-binding protein
MGQSRRGSGLSGAAIVFAVGLVWAGLALSPGQADGQTRLKFIVWNYQVETVKEFITQFETENPDIKVDMEVIPGVQYVAKIQLMRNANTPFDALYVFDHILSQWASWLEPLDGYEGAAALKKTLLPVALQSMTYKGKLYGMPYFTSYFGLIYNDRMLKAAGFDGPPKTYEEWTQQAKVIKSKGLSKAPMLWPVKHAGWGGMWVLYAMAASRGGKVLDDGLAVTPVGMDALKWWAGTYREGLSDVNNIELDPNESARAFMSGDHATMLSTTFFAGAQWANDPEKSKIAGVTKLGPTPNLRKTVGFARLYSVNGASAHKAEAWRLVKFLGGVNKAGDYVTPKQWVAKGALTWGHRGVEKDPVVVASLKSWGAVPDDMAANLENAAHMSAIVPFQAPWYAEWELYANGVLQNVLGGRVSPDEGAQLWTKKARELAARYK